MLMGLDIFGLHVHDTYENFAKTIQLVTVYLYRNKPRSEFSQMRGLY